MSLHDQHILMLALLLRRKQLREEQAQLSAKQG